MKRLLGMVLGGLLLAAPGWAQAPVTVEKELLNLERQ